MKAKAEWNDNQYFLLLSDKYAIPMDNRIHQMGADRITSCERSEVGIAL